MEERKQTKQKVQLNNAGFTLVEVLVSLAIMVIVSAAIGTFIVSGNKSFVRGNNDITIQEEVQLSLNQIIDLIVDVDKKIDYKASGLVSELRLYNKDATYMLRWQGNDGSTMSNTVYYYETGATDGAVFEDITAHTGYLLAEYVTSFQVDLSKLKRNVVILNMSYQYMDETYEVSETIKLRNDLNPKTEAKLTWINDLYIVPDNHSMKRGTSFDFDYVMTGEEEAVNQGVTWKVERVDGKAIQSGTMIDGDGKLRVADTEEEGVGALLITATSVADSSKSATASVTVEKEELPFDKGDVELILRTLTTEEYVDGKKQYVAIIECLPDYADYLNGYPKITWSETTNPSAYRIVEETQFTAKLYCGSMNDTEAYVNAVIELEEGVFVEKGISITLKKFDVVEDKDKPYIHSDNFVLNRNDSVDLELRNYNKEGDVTWRISDTQGLGSTDSYARMVGFDPIDGEFDGVNNVRNYADTHVGMDATVHAKWMIDFNKEYRLTVQAVEEDGDVIAEAMVLIPRFEILFSGGEHYQTIDAIPNGIWYRKYYLEVYGFTAGQHGGAGGNNRVLLKGELQADKEMATGTKIANLTFDWLGDYIAMDVDGSEENEYIVLILWDERRPEAKRSLMFLIE